MVIYLFNLLLGEYLICTSGETSHKCITTQLIASFPVDRLVSNWAELNATFDGFKSLIFNKLCDIEIWINSAHLLIDQLDLEVARSLGIPSGGVAQSISRIEQQPVNGIDKPPPPQTAFLLFVASVVPEILIGYSIDSLRNKDVS